MRSSEAAMISRVALSGRLTDLTLHEHNSLRSSPVQVPFKLIRVALKAAIGIRRTKLFRTTPFQAASEESHISTLPTLASQTIQASLQCVVLHF